jgi:hypothetical protein
MEQRQDVILSFANTGIFKSLRAMVFPILYETM